MGDEIPTMIKEALWAETLWLPPEERLDHSYLVHVPRLWYD
jgi:hypothetical protein